MPPEHDINIAAAQEYVQSAERDIEPAALGALNILKGALDASSQTHTKDSLMKLAKDVEDAQSDGKKEFAVDEFEKRITVLIKRVETIDIPHNATAEYIVEKVYETGNEMLIDGTELLLGTLNENLSIFSLTPYERENIKIGILGYVFEHYYEVLGGLKISDLQNIFSDLTKTVSDITQLTKKPAKNEGIVDSLTSKWNALSGLVTGGSDSLSKVTGILDNSTKIEDKIQKNLTGKFGPLIELLTKYRNGKDVPPEGDVLSGFLSDPENILNFDTRFPAQTGETLEQKIADAPHAPQEKTTQLATKLKTVFENKTAILDKVTGTGKNILDTFADSTDTSGPLSWGRDIAAGVLKFLGNLPFIGNFIKGLLGIDTNEDIETYFGDEKRFQRLSAKSLRSLSEKENTILNGKNLINVTTKRLAPFTKAYFGRLNSNKDAKPEEKIMSMSSDVWMSIIDKHEIPLPGGNKRIENTELYIGDSDFDGNGKPLKSFFDKINGLKKILEGLSPAPIPPVGGESPAPAPAEKPEVTLAGKTQSEIADMITTEGDAMVTKYSEEAKAQPESDDNTKLQAELKKIGDALATRDIKKVDQSLALMRLASGIDGKLNLQQKAALASMDALIEAWKKAPDKVTLTPVVPLTKGDNTKPEITPKPQEEARPPTFVDKVLSGAKPMIRTGLEWLISKV